MHGTPLITFQRVRSADGAELPLQAREERPADPYVSTQVCRRTDGASGPAAQPAPVDRPTPAEAPAEAPAPTLLRGHPNRTIAYPGNVMVTFDDYAKTPERAVVELTFTPLGPGTPATVRRTVLALRTSPAFDDSRPLDQTAYLPVLDPGAFRIQAALVAPDGSRRPLALRGPDGTEGPEVELRWTREQRYREGGKTPSVIANPPR